jgi:chromosome segregation ATPase
MVQQIREFKQQTHGQHCRIRCDGSSSQLARWVNTVRCCRRNGTARNNSSDLRPPKRIAQLDGELGFEWNPPCTGDAARNQASQTKKDSPRRKRKMPSQQKASSKDKVKKHNVKLSVKKSKITRTAYP